MEEAFQMSPGLLLQYSIESLEGPSFLGLACNHEQEEFIKGQVTIHVIVQ